MSSTLRGQPKPQWRLVRAKAAESGSKRFCDVDTTFTDHNGSELWDAITLSHWKDRLSACKVTF